MDAEKVIKALEWLIVNFPKQDNPKDDSDRLCNCINLYCQNAVDLIKRQQAEIEQWKEEAIKHQDLWCAAEKDISNARIEAQKDFADILLMVAKGSDGFVDACDILNTLYVITGKDEKELTEGSNGE